MNRVSEEEVLNLAETVKSVIFQCKEQNNQIQQILRKTKIPNCDQFPGKQEGCGDAKEANTNKNSYFQRSHFSELIKIKTEENLLLRESNVKLRNESKTQDQKIRELNRRLVLQNRLNQKVESQKTILRHLKNAVDEKSSEIRNLKKNLEDVKSLRANLQEKSKSSPKHRPTVSLRANLQEKSKSSPKHHPTVSAPFKLKTGNEVVPKLEHLLSQLSQLNFYEELAKSPVCYSDSLKEKIENALKCLVLVKVELEKRNSIEKVVRVKTDKCIQGPDDSDVNGNFKIVRENACNHFLDQRPQTAHAGLKIGRLRTLTV